MKRKLNLRYEPKTVALILNAIKQLKEKNGSTIDAVSDYIAAEYNVPVSKVKRAVASSLHRGVQLGAINRSRKGLYSLNEDILNYVKQHRRGRCSKSCSGRPRRSRCRRRRRRSCRRRRRRSCRRRRRRSCRRRRRRCRRRRRRCRRRRRRSGCRKGCRISY